MSWSTRSRAAAVVAAFAVAFAVPLALSGEIGVWVFEEPVSHLVWDEAMIGPGEEGSAPPGPGSTLSSPLMTAWTLAVLPATLAAAVSVWARRLTLHP